MNQLISGGELECVSGGPHATKHFSQWFGSASDSNRIRGLCQCWYDTYAYGFMDVEPLAAARILTVLLKNQREPKEFCTWYLNDHTYYQDTGYINPETRQKIASLEDVSGLNRRDYSHALMELVEFGPLYMTWQYDDFGQKTRLLRVDLQAIAEVWQDASEVGRTTFEQDGYVYVLGAPGYYKIGRAKCVDSRIKQLGIQLPWPVEVMHTIPCEEYAQSERALHEKFADRRANGEWFALTENDVTWLRTVARMRGNYLEVGGRS